MTTRRGLGKGKGSGWKNMMMPRKVTARQFFITRFRRDPSHRAEKGYYQEWKKRFASGQPSAYMDNISLRVLHGLQTGRMKVPNQKLWKNKGGLTLRIVEVKRRR